MAVLVSAAVAGSAATAAAQDVGTHIVVGVEPVSAFDIVVAGGVLPGSPATSSQTGVLSFDVDASSLPPGPNAVIVSQNGELIVGGVTAESVTSSTAVITWNTNLPSSSRVEYGTTPGYGSSSTLDPTLVTDHSVTLSGLIAGTVYYFRAVSEAEGGVSAESGGHTFETALGELVISDVQSTDITSDSVRIRWTTDRPATSQVVYGETAAYGEDSGEDPALVTSHDVLIVGLEADTEYHYAVVSVDAYLNSTQSTDATFTTAVTPLAVFEITCAAESDSAVVTWRTTRPADTRVEYGMTPGYGFETALKTELVEIHSDTLRGLVPGETYHYRVRSEAANGDVAYSVDDEFDTEPEPLVITDVIADAGVSSATITWVTNRSGDSMVEYGRTAEYGQTSPLDPRMVLGHEVGLTGLDAGTTYHYRVRSEDEHGEFVWSDDATFETLMPAPEIAGVTVTSRGVTWAVIEWTTDQPSEAWVLWGTTPSLGDSTAGSLDLVASHACTLTGLTESTEYHYLVGARNGQGTVAISPIGTFQTMQGIPLAPPELVGPSARAVSMVSVAVTWATDVPATSCVRYGIPGGDTLVVACGELKLLHEIVISPVVPFAEYQYCVESGCPGGSATSDPCRFQTGPSLGADQDDKEPLIIRPEICVVGERDAAVRWATDRPCSTWVEYGRDTEYGTMVPAVATGDCGYESHILHLEPDTEYYFRIHAQDALGSTVTSDGSLFRTLAPPDLWPPDPPSAMTCRLMEGWVEVTWAASTACDLAGYNVYRVRMSSDPAEPDRTEKLNEALLGDALYIDHEVEAGLMYSYQATAVDSAGNESAHSPSASVTLPPPPPAAVAFSHYPNPSHGEATMAFAVPGPESSRVDLRVLSIDGRVVRHLAEGEYPPGEHTTFWDGNEGSGEMASSGIYVCELRVDDTVVRRKMTLLR